MDGADGRRQFAGGAALEHVAARAGLERLHHIRLVVVHAQDQHGQVGVRALDLPQGLQAVEPGHRHVEHHDIRAGLGRLLDRAGAVIGFRHNHHVAHRFERQTDTLAQHGVVVGQEHANG